MREKLRLVLTGTEHIDFSVIWLPEWSWYEVRGFYKGKTISFYCDKNMIEAAKDRIARELGTKRQVIFLGGE